MLHSSPRMIWSESDREGHPSLTTETSSRPQGRYGSLRQPEQLANDDNDPPFPPLSTQQSVATVLSPFVTLNSGQSRSRQCLGITELIEILRETGSLGNLTIPHKFPQGDQQLSRQSHDPDPPLPTVPMAKSPGKPRREGTIRLEMNPTPGDFDEQPP